MNDRALSGVIMIGAAGLLAWAWLTGRLDKQIATVVGRVRAAAPATAGSAGKSGFAGGAAGAGGGGGGGGSW